jgi:alcohol dehydrogenase
MKAFAIDARKAALRPREMPDPVAGPGEVVVDIAAAGVNPLDVKLREGAFKLVLPYRMPLVLWQGPIVRPTTRLARLLYTQVLQQRGHADRLRDRIALGPAQR